MVKKIKKQDFKEAYKIFGKDKDISANEKALNFMKEVVETLGTDTDVINKAIEAVTEIEGEEDNPKFKVKLLNDTQKTKEYKKVFESEQGKDQENTR